MRGQKHASDDFRAYLGHTETAAVDFAVILWAEVRFLLGHALFVSAGSDNILRHLPSTSSHDANEESGAHY